MSEILLPAERCFAAIVAMHLSPPPRVDLVSIAKSWPRPLAVRYLNGMETASAVASLLALPNRFETARVGQMLRDMALDKGVDWAASKLLRALREANFARAATLRRDMEWEERDAAFFPVEVLCERTGCKSRAELQHLGAELRLHLAVLADELWDRLLPMPNLYRLPAPAAYPDSWPETIDVLAPPDLPEVIPDDASAQLRAGIEWLHLWRLDHALADRIWKSVPEAQAQSWMSAITSAIDPTSTAPLPRDLVVLEELMEDRANVLSLLEVDALLKGVTEPPEDERWCCCTVEARQGIQKAVKKWLERVGRQ